MKRNTEKSASTGEQLGHNSYIGRKTGWKLGALTVALTLMLSTASAMAADVQFNDLQNFDWAKPSIEAMAAKEVIKGYGNGKFGPSDQVTREQFASMAIRAFGDMDAMVAKANDLAKADPSSYTSLEKINGTYPGNWSNETMCASQVVPTLDRTFGISRNAWQEPASRSEMAAIVMSIAEANGMEFEIKDGIQNNIGDYNNGVKNSQYEQFILKAYSNGILVGTNNEGNYSPSELSNRAQAAIVMHRAMDPSVRSEVVVKPAEVAPPMQEGENIGTYGTVFPKEGDIINGVKVARDPVTGVLGFGNGQKGGIYLGIQEIYADGTKHPIKVGSTSSNSYDNMHLGSVYTERHGYIFWGSEWELIYQAASAKVKSAVKPSASTVGTKADIHGNIIKAGDTTTPAFWEIKSIIDYYAWNRIS